MARYTSIRQIPRFTREPNYQVDLNWDYIPSWLESHNPDMDPDFQRGHVWTRGQQIAFVEFCLKGGTSGRNLYFNAPDFMRSRGGLVVVDGKQRLTAVFKWITNEYPVFGETYYRDLGHLPLSDHNTSFRVHINNLKTRAEILKWYLEMNEGGTPHTFQEIHRVKVMYLQEIGAVPTMTAEELTELMRGE